MRFHFTAVPVHGGGDAERELNVFLGAHRVVRVERQLVVDGAASVWAICVAYTLGGALAPMTPATAPASSGKKERVDYREVLGPDDFATFIRLRELRRGLAERDGVPPYAVFTNEQLAEIIRRKVATAAGLIAIDGIGPARVEKYGAPVLDLLRTAPSVPGAATAAAPSAGREA